MHRLLVIGVAAVAAFVFSGSALAWSWPAEGEVLRPFTLGDDVYAPGQHRGIDVGGAEGSAVVAPTSGVVSFAGSLPTYGRGVTIVTGDGYAVTLVHLGSISVAKGDTVEEGRPVGSMGWSGDTEHAAPSVHLGVRIAAQPEGYVDPIGLLPPRRTAPVAPPAPTPAPAPAPAPTPPVSSPSPGPDLPQPPSVPAAVAPAAPTPAAPEPEPQSQNASGPVSTPAAEVPAVAEGSAPVATFRIGGRHPARAPRAGATPATGRSDRLHEAASPAAPSVSPKTGDALPIPARDGASTAAVHVRSSAAPAAVGGPRPADVGSRHADAAGAELLAGTQAGHARPSRARHDAVASVSSRTIAVDTRVRQPALVARAIAPGRDVVGDDSGVAPGAIAAAAALLLLALGAAARGARRIGADRAVPRDDVASGSTARRWSRSSLRTLSRRSSAHGRMHVEQRDGRHLLLE